MPDLPRKDRPSKAELTPRGYLSSALTVPIDFRAVGWLWRLFGGSALLADSLTPFRVGRVLPLVLPLRPSFLSRSAAHIRRPHTVYCDSQSQRQHCYVWTSRPPACYTLQSIYSCDRPLPTDSLAPFRIAPCRTRSRSACQKGIARPRHLSRCSAAHEEPPVIVPSIARANRVHVVLLTG